MRTPTNPVQPDSGPRQTRLVLTPRFTAAVDYARQLHTEYRKGTDIPYMAHLLGVTALVMGEAGGRVPVTEDMVIAAVLHDVVEDHGGLPRLKEVEKRFGPQVARMVAALSDTFAEDHDKKEGWEERKNAYLAKLRSEPGDVLLISAADKLYNAKAILDDYSEIGPAVFNRFKRGADQQLWYFDELLKIFLTHPRNRIVNELERVIAQLKQQIAAKA
jgi:(p)ppGpp synthase/HD superfamily hydrolase